MDADEQLDVVTGMSANGSMALNVLVGPGDGSFELAKGSLPTEGSFAAQFMDAGNLDGDGDLDVASSNTAGRTGVFLGHGDGKPDLVGVLLWPGHGEGRSTPGTVQVLLTTTL